MPLHPSNRRLGPLDSRFEQGKYLGLMDGSNTVLGVVKARTNKRLPPDERWTGSLLDEELGSELTPNALEEDGGRVRIRAPVSQPHEAVLLPPLAPEVRQVRRAPLRRTDFERFGYTANCPGCANARAGRKQEWIIQNSAVPAWKQFVDDRRRSRTTIVLLKSPRNQRMRRLSARDIALRAKGSNLLRRPGKGAAVAVAAVRRCRLRLRHSHLNHHHLQKRCLEHETEMTDATVEQQTESKRRREHPEVRQAADSSSSSSSSSESTTDTGMGLVDVCTVLCDNSEGDKRCESGPITLDITKWDFNKADCRNKCRKLET